MIKRLRSLFATAVVAVSSLVSVAPAHAVSNHSGEFTLLGNTGSILGNITNSADSTQGIVGFEFYLGTASTTNLSFNLAAMSDPLPAWVTAFDVAPSGTTAQGLSFDATVAGYGPNGVPAGAPFWFGIALAYTGSDNHFANARVTAFYQDGFEKTIYLDPAKEFAQGQFVPYFDNTTPPVPEPGTLPLMIAGIGVMGFVVRRRRSA